jgi:hypothetical protein
MSPEWSDMSIFELFFLQGSTDSNNIEIMRIIHLYKSSLDCFFLKNKESHFPAIPWREEVTFR